MHCSDESRSPRGDKRGRTDLDLSTDPEVNSRSDSMEYDEIDSLMPNEAQEGESDSNLFSDITD